MIRCVFKWLFVFVVKSSSVTVPYPYLMTLPWYVYINVMVDSVGGDMVCNQGALNGNPLQCYNDIRVSISKRRKRTDRRIHVTHQRMHARKRTHAHQNNLINVSLLIFNNKTFLQITRNWILQFCSCRSATKRIIRNF